MFNKEETIEFLLKGIVDTSSRKAIEEKVNEVYNEGRVLNIKLGLDPSAPDIHLGHAVVLRKIRQLQDLGHIATIIIGDFTGMIGDPTGKSKTRNQLTKEQVKINAETYKEQIFKIIKEEQTSLRFNSEWYDQMSFSDVISLCSKSTVARMLEREDFKNRYTNQKPIAIHEFFYPLMQAYDSVVIESDIELGGTDQTFNILMGRNIQKDYGVSQQIAIFMPLLEGTDGKEKMSKSLNNYIGINESANDMYVKVMKIPDELILKYYELTTDVHPKEISAIKSLLESGKVNPRDIKMKLARDIIILYHDEKDLKKAEESFVSIYQQQQIPTSAELPKIIFDDTNLEEGTIFSLIDCLHSTNCYKSKSEIRRLITQGAVKINGSKTTDFEFAPISGMHIQVGKGTIFELESFTENSLEEEQKQDFQKALTK